MLYIPALDMQLNISMQRGPGRRRVEGDRRGASVVEMHHVPKAIATAGLDARSPCT